MEEKEFQEMHEQLQDDNFLIERIFAMTDKFLKDKAFENIDDAVLASVTLVAFPYSGKEKLEEEELHKVIEEIYLKFQSFEGFQIH